MTLTDWHGRFFYHPSTLKQDCLSPPSPYPPKEEFVWQGTSSPGVGVLRFNGAAWETGWHFCPRDSLNVIINQPTIRFFSTTPICLGLKDKNEKGVGVLRFNGAAWETGWHFCPRDSLNVIINQPTSLFFEAHRVTATLNGGKHTRRREKGCGALFALGETVLLTG